MTQDETTPSKNEKANKFAFLQEDKEEYLRVVKENNTKYMDLWRDTPYAERGLFLPHCMRHSSECESETYKFGRICVFCMKCQLGIISKTAKELGIPSYIVPGGSMLLKILEYKMPKVAMGIACPFELAQAMEKMGEKGCPMVGVELLRDGCKDTATDVEKALEALRAKSF